MAQALDEIGTAVPLDRHRRIRFVLPLAEVQGAPANQQRALVVGEAQFVRPVGLVHGRGRFQEGKDRVGIFSRDPCIARKRHGRIEQFAVARLTRVQHRIELIGGPRTDPVFAIRRNIGCEQCPKGRIHLETATELPGTRIGVTGNAIPCPREILASLEHIRIGRRCNSRRPGNLLRLGHALRTRCPHPRAGRQHHAEYDDGGLEHPQTGHHRSPSNSVGCCRRAASGASLSPQETDRLAPAAKQGRQPLR